MKPSFIGLGAQKCASTWLHRVLAAHPAVTVPAVKEVDFFSYRFDHGYQWYERQFGAGAASSCAGEVSPSYFHDPAAPARVKRYCPDVRILLTLRDPVERALSNHRHEVRLGHLVGRDLSFEAGLRNNPMYIEQGLYAKHLENWLACFPLSQIHVVLLEDIEVDPDGVAEGVFRFLGIDAAVRPEQLNQHFNQSVSSRSQRLFNAKERLYRASQDTGLSWIWSAAVRIGARDLYRRLNTAPPDEVEATMCAQTEQKLRQRFAADIDSLESLLGRSLDQWRRNPGRDCSCPAPRAVPAMHGGAS